MGTWSPGPAATTGADTFNGDSSAETVDGLAGGDVLLGNGGNDTLNGGDDNDLLIGGAGVDSLHGDNGNDVISMIYTEPQSGEIIDGGAGTDTLRYQGGGVAAFQTLSVLSIERLQFTGQLDISVMAFSAFQIDVGLIAPNAVIEGSGSPAQDTLILTMGAPGVFSVGFTYTVWNADDVTEVFGTSGVDHIGGGVANDVLHGDASQDFLAGFDGDDVLDGGDGDDVLDGFNGADTLDGGVGADLMRGEDGDDTFVLRDTTMAGGKLCIGGAGSDRLLFTSNTFGAADFHLDVVYVENVERIAFDAVNATSVSLTLGDAQIGDGELADATTVQGAAGIANLFIVNTFDEGNYSLASFVFQNWDANDVITLNGNNSANTISGSSVWDTINGLDGDDTLDGLAGDDFLFGNDGVDALSGGDGDDALDGGDGGDTMIGGDGADTYVVDNTGDVVTETSNQGIDVVQASVTFALAANVENLTLTGTGAINGFGNVLNNVISGNGAANQLNGFDGNDTLNGGAGADNMFGGNGDDTYVVDNTGDQTTETSALGGIDTVFSVVTRNLTANIENLTLTGAAAVTGAGNALNNIITGNSGANTLYGFDGNDRLDGGAGADTLFGANGNDTYVVDNVNDITVEGSPSGGVDTVESSVSRNLNANFENLTLTGTAQFGYGNILNNVITGNAAANGLYGFDGNDTLDGGAGADQMFGANGDDTYIVDNAGDVTSEVSALGGIDTVISSVTRNLTANLENLTLSGNAAITGAGNALNNVLIGNTAANTLYGLDGADTLNGGLGADTLQGGNGADTYVFSSALGAGNIDAVVGFSVVDDTIRLDHAIFTGLIDGVLDAGAFHVGAAAADADDHIIYDSATGALYWDADGAGGGAQVQFATLAAGLALTNNDFIVGGS